jgi:hypothetical protein
MLDNEECQQRWKQYLNPSLDLTTPWSKKEVSTTRSQPSLPCILAHSLRSCLTGRNPQHSHAKRCSSNREGTARKFPKPVPELDTSQVRIPKLTRLSLRYTFIWTNCAIIFSESSNTSLPDPITAVFGAQEQEHDLALVSICYLTSPPRVCMMPTYLTHKIPYLGPTTRTTARTSGGHHECEPEDADEDDDDDDDDDDEVQIMLEAPTSARPPQQASSSWGPSSVSYFILSLEVSLLDGSTQATYGGSPSAPASASAPCSPSAPTSPAAPTSPYTPISSFTPVTPAPPQDKKTYVELARMLFNAPHASLECKMSAGSVLFDHIFDLADGSQERLELARDLFITGEGIISSDMLSCAETVMHEYIIGNNF